jgi:hypothetical protein
MRKGRATVLRLHLAVALLAGAGLLLVSVSARWSSAPSCTR